MEHAPVNRYAARRFLFIRSVTIRPSFDQSKPMDPPSWLDMLRSTILLPNPPGVVGATTSGPPRSVQRMTNSLPWAGQDTWACRLPPRARHV